MPARVLGRVIPYLWKNINLYFLNTSSSQRNQKPRVKHLFSPTKIPLEASEFSSRGYTSKIKFHCHISFKNTLIHLSLKSNILSATQKCPYKLSNSTLGVREYKYLHPCYVDLKKHPRLHKKPKNSTYSNSVKILQSKQDKKNTNKTVDIEQKVEGSV